MCAHAVGASVDGAARGSSAIDQFIQQTHIVGETTSDNFGWAVDVNGSTAIIGSGADRGAGAAYVFVRSGNTWSFQAKLTLPPNHRGEGFGNAAAVSGDTALVGSFNDSSSGIDGLGSAYVFVRSGTVWSFQQKLVPPDGVPGGNFGTSVALDGGTAAISAPYDTGRPGITERVGSTYIYVRSGSGWIILQKLVPSDAGPGDAFGFGTAVSLVSGTLIIGAPYHDARGSANNGMAYVFTRVGPTWVQESILEAGEGGREHRFGVDVATDGTRLIIGTAGPRPDPAYVFSRRSAPHLPGGPPGFALEARLLHTTEVSGSFATKVAIDRDLALVGATSASRAFVFRRVGDVWTEQQELIPAAVTSRFGSAVAVEDETLFVGAVEDRAPLEADGSVFVFVNPTPSAPQRPVLAPPQVTGSTVRLDWTPSSGAARYRLRAGMSPGQSDVFDGDVGSLPSITATDIGDGSYFVRVHAVGATGGESAASNEVRVDVGAVSTCVALPAPSSLARTVAGALVTLTWNAVLGATGYVVEAALTAGGATIATIETASPSLMASAPPGTYFVRVRSRSSCGTGAASAPITVAVG
jgi:hypothetical protein